MCMFCRYRIPECVLVFALRLLRPRLRRARKRTRSLEKWIARRYADSKSLWGRSFSIIEQQVCCANTHKEETKSDCSRVIIASEAAPFCAITANGSRIDMLAISPRWRSIMCRSMAINKVHDSGSRAQSTDFWMLLIQMN